MYSVSIREQFIARHFLAKETGKEGTPHSHHYFVEVCAFGDRLDAQGFLINIVDLKHQLHLLVNEICDRLLNDLEVFRGTIPTLENLAHQLWVQIAPRLKGTNVSSIKVTVWEEEYICASFEGKVST
jgi:6-pyruvoyltetrahydropterin/6-carboxytetrahydropterin synthase